MVIVVGAGITGLAAAFELAERSAEFTVLEASDRAGGLILTEHVDGFTIDAGPDSMLVQKPAAIRLCEELGLGPRLIATNPPRTAFVLESGTLHPLPTPSILGIPTTWSGIARYTLLPIGARARLALEPLMPRAGAAGDESVGSFFRRRFGRDSVRLIAQPLLGGIHAGNVESLSIHSLFPRLVEAEARRGSIIRAFHPGAVGASSTASAVDAGEGLFRSLRSGMGELVSAIERRLPSGSMQFGRPATAIRREHTGWRVTSGTQAFDASAVILATPAHVTARLLAPVDVHVANLCAEVPYVSTVSVALAWPRASVSHPLDGSGFVAVRHPGACRITACTWVSAKWSGRAPQGSVLLRAFIGGVQDPDAVSLPDDVLIETAVRDMSSVLGISAPPMLARVHRWRDAGAQHTVGHLARAARIDARLSALPGLHLAGSGHRAIGIPDCVADGRAAAARAIGSQPR
jgi:oxygen-dependent protoporphyrinogen oxidase